MNNAEKFKRIFGLYATELWSMPESDFLEWLNRDVETTQIDHTADIGKKVSISCGHENDLISRQAAIDAYGDWYVEEGTEEGFIGTVKQLLEGLPSAQPATNCSEIPNGSDDAISRRAAIDAIMGQPPEPHYPSWYAAQIEKLPAVQPEQRWIPVTERLTENDNEVLITVWDAEDDYVEVYKGFYQGHEWWTQWCHGCSKIKDEPCGENIVIAWMPLPEPYRGGDEDERNRIIEIGFAHFDDLLDGMEAEL